MIFLVLFLSLTLLVGCTSATPITTATALITVTPIPPTPTPKILSTIDVQETAVASVPVHQPDWTFTTGGAIMSPITVADGVVYFGSDDSYLYAVNSTTHDLKWKFKTDGDVRSQPAVAENTVYAASDDSYLYAVAKSDGSMLWKVQVEKEAITRTTDLLVLDDYFTSSPVVQDTTLYIGSTDGSLYALDAGTGKTLWKYFAGNFAIRTTPLVADGMVYFGDIFGNYFAVDAKDGTKIWKYAASDRNYANGMTLSDQVLYFCTSSSLNALDASTGKVKWTTVLMGGYCARIPAYENGTLYGDGYYNDHFQPVGAYEAETGKLFWVSSIGGIGDMSNFLASPAISKDAIYFGSDPEGFYAVDKKTGAVKWKLVVFNQIKGSGVNSSPAVADGVVYFGGMDGVLYAVKDQ